MRLHLEWKRKGRAEELGARGATLDDLWVVHVVSEIQGDPGVWRPLRRVAGGPWVAVGPDRPFRRHAQRDCHAAAEDAMNARRTA